MNNKIVRQIVVVVVYILSLFVLAASTSYGQKAITKSVGMPPPRVPYAGGPPQELTGLIRIPKEFGVVPAGPGLGQAAALPCAPYFVAVLNPRDNNKVVAATDGLLEPGREDATFYTCKYSLMVPRDISLYAVAGMGGTSQLAYDKRWPMYTTDAWVGGSNNKPRRGYERSFPGHFVTLGNKGMYLRFDMSYVQVNPD